MEFLINDVQAVCFPNDVPRDTCRNYRCVSAIMFMHTTISVDTSNGIQYCILLAMHELVYIYIGTPQRIFVYDAPTQYV